MEPPPRQKFRNFGVFHGIDFLVPTCKGVSIGEGFKMLEWVLRIEYNFTIYYVIPSIYTHNFLIRL